MKFDKPKTSRFNCRIVAIAMVGLGRSKLQGVRYATLNNTGGFFVPCFHQLVELVQEALSLPLLPCRTVDQPASTSPFSLGRGTGVELQGASL